jgi:hypothetical protein
VQIQTFWVLQNVAILFAQCGGVNAEKFTENLEVRRTDLQANSSRLRRVSYQQPFELKAFTFIIIKPK